MASFDIGSASMGYDIQGMKTLLEQIDINVFKRSIEVLKPAVDECEAAIREIWSGQSAEAFITKLHKDSNVIENDLNKLHESLEAQFGAIIANYDNVDTAIAAQINNM